MIKKIFYTLLITLTCFIGLNKVSASSDFTNPYVRVNGNNFFDNSVTINSSYDFRFDVGVFYNGGNSNVGSPNNRIYGRLALCTSGSINSPYSHTDFVNTKISCDNGFVSFIYFDLVYESSGNFTTYFLLTPLYTSSVDVKFFGLSFSYTPFDRYNSEDTLIKQTDSILTDLQLLYYKTSDGFTQVTYKLDDTIKELQDLKSLLSQLLNSCRDSYNLFNMNSFVDTNQISKTSNTSITINENNLGYVSTGVSLKTFAPNLKVGDKVYFSFNHSDSSARDYFYLELSKKALHNNSFITLSQDDLDSKVVVYAIQGQENVISNIMFSFKVSSFEPYGEQICKSKVDETNDAINQTNEKLSETNQKLQESQDFMKDDDISGSSSEAQEFFEGFTTDTYGLTSVITAPLTLIGNLATTSCSPVPLSVPYVGGTLSLPCMTPIYERHFKGFFDIYQSITFGIIAYWVCVRVFALVKDFKNPDNDEIEVMDL